METNKNNKNIPRELWGIWYELADPYQNPGHGFTNPRINIEFTENQCGPITDEGNKSLGGHNLARINENNEIEYTDSKDSNFSHPKTLCHSYTISNGILTFKGGEYDNRAYKKNPR